MQSSRVALASLIAVLAICVVWVIVRPTRNHASKQVAAPIRSEGCLTCHGAMTGFSVFHQPETIGCQSCHSGNPRTTDAREAHKGMILVPGNLATAPQTCGTTACHESIVPRVENSIMATFAGVIDADRRVFGETTASKSPPHVRDLGHSAADSHLRQLCASCHLGQNKSEWGPITQESRGGGCNACHLSYSAEAHRELSIYQKTPPSERTAAPNVHPSLTMNVTNDHCFGCHSRSGRISTNYEGWHELRDPPAREDQPQCRRLDDGRYFTRVTPDVHHERGLDCIDCHTSGEVMGTGEMVAHKRDALQVRCEDCHAEKLSSMPVSSLDRESAILTAMRGRSFKPLDQMGVTRDGKPLINVTVDADGHGNLTRKRTGETLPLKPPATACTRGKGHDRLSCGSCHTPWAPRCASCHTSFDPAGKGFDLLTQIETKGEWNESSGPFLAAPPTLGIRNAPGRPDGVVDTFVPGMILTIDRNLDPGSPPDTLFRRLYAHTSAHTTQRESRSCQSCHNNPVALGFGEGSLVFETKEGSGRWRFSPKHPPLPEDGLPADAWTGFLQTREGMVSTRDDARPFSVGEQRRILRVGACLTCHEPDSPAMRDSVADFEAMLKRMSPKCVVPEW